MKRLKENDGGSNVIRRRQPVQSYLISAHIHSLHLIKGIYGMPNFCLKDQYWLMFPKKIKKIVSVYFPEFIIFSFLLIYLRA